MKMRISKHLAVSCLAALLAACSGGDPVGDPQGADPAGGNCSGDCATPASRLTVADVERVLAQGIAEAQARNAQATFAVVDRAGNVLAVFRMGNAAARSVVLATHLDGDNAVIEGGLEGIRLPVAAAPVNIDGQAAIAKAVTGAYLSSEGNAFSTRTAGQIVQENFNPGERFQAAGPLFGVQFSQLACSDLMGAFDNAGPGPGPQRSPLGLSADPGGFPLYKNGTVVGGVGAIADGVYGLDRDVTDIDEDLDEAIAYAATFGFAAPLDRRGDRIAVEGRTLRFSDVDFGQLRSTPGSAPALAAIPANVGMLVAVNGYFDGVIRAGTAFGQPASGVRADGEVDFPGQDAFVLVDRADQRRYAPRAGTDAAALGAAVLTQAESRTLLRAALDVTNRSRAQIRRPPGSPARVTISLVDTRGEILGIVRARDAPVFGIDVSLQKARTAALLSSADVGAYLRALPNAKYLATSDASVRVARAVRIGEYVTAAQSFLEGSLPSDPAPNPPGPNGPGVLLDGRIAFSSRALGNLSRPFFPDGIEGEPPGPFSKPAGEWSVLSTGLQLDVAINAILQHVLFSAGVPGIPDVARGCAGVDLADSLGAVMQTVTNLRLGNGLQIFPGGVPIYRGATLVGAIGISGDGIEQDDMIAFLGVHEAGQMLGGALGNAPAPRRADMLAPRGSRLRYVQCPPAPFLQGNADNVCRGK